MRLRMTALALIVCSSLMAACTDQKPITPPTEEDTFVLMVERSYDLAEQWLVSNVRSKGLFFYIYHPKTDEYPDKNNAIRQLMASRLLAEISQEKLEHLELHRANLAFHMEHWYKEEDGLGYVFYNGKSKLGANAMLLRTLVWSPFYAEHQTQAKQLADGILALMDEQGAFHPWFKEPDYDYDKDYLLTFYSGEALLALVEYYAKTGDERYLEAAKKAQAFYIDRYVDQMDTYYYPAYVPWHTMALNKLYKITGDQAYADAIFAMNDKLLELLDRTNEIGRFFNPATPQYGTPHSSSDGVYTDGLAYAYEIAQLTGDQARAEAYQEALFLAVTNLVKLQYTDESAIMYDRPGRAVGALRYSIDRSGIRVDTVQHAMDAYLKILDLFTQE